MVPKIGWLHWRDSFSAASSACSGLRVIAFRRALIRVHPGARLSLDWPLSWEAVV